MKDTKDKLHYKTKEIIDIMTRFYKQLYTSGSPHKENIVTFFKKYANMPKLTKLHKDWLDRLFTPKEIEESIKT